MAGKILVDYKSPQGPRVIHVRSTLISSSLHTLREAGLYEQYLALLPQEHHEVILMSIGPEWLPANVALTHYATCEALGLSDMELERVGEAVSGRIMGTFLGTLVRSSRNVGTSPWVPLGQYDRIWSRIFDGGTCVVEQTGPKDALIRSNGVPMFEQRYFRLAYQGVVKAACHMFARTVVVKTSRVTGNPTSLLTTLSWV